MLARIQGKELQHTVGGTVNWCSQYEKQYGSSSKHKKQSYHIIQQFYCQIYSLRKLKHQFGTNAPQCSQQHYLQQPRYANNPSTHQQMNGKRKCGVYLYKEILLSHKKTIKFCHLQQCGWTFYRVLLSQTKINCYYHMYNLKNKTNNCL